MAGSDFTGLAPLILLPLIWIDRKAGSGPEQDPDELGTNLALGGVMLLGDLLILGGFAVLYSTIGPHVRLIDPPTPAIQLLLAIVAGDFLSYWHHRLMHASPWFWASHVVHHQSRLIELSTGLRNHPFATLSSGVFWSPVLLLGISPVIILLAAGLIGTWVILIHRRDSSWFPALPKAFSFVLNTPAHHRLHHNRDRKLGNGNYGLLLIVWDRLFSSYRDPLRGVQNYGVEGASSTGRLRTLLWREWKRVLVGRAQERASESSIKPSTGAAVYVVAVAVLIAAQFVLVGGG